MRYEVNIIYMLVLVFGVYFIDEVFIPIDIAIVIRST